MTDEKMPKILHIDDDEDFLDLFALTFGHWFSITSLNNPQEVLEHLENEEFDAVISDFNMPQMTGLELLKLLRNKNVNTPFILFTCQGNEEVAREAFISGASDYFTKDMFGFAHKEKLRNSILRARDVRKTERELHRHRQHLEELVEERTHELIRMNRMLQQEIKERGNIEETLRKNEEKYRSIFENIQDIYYEISLDGVILEVSPSIETVIGLNREQLIGSSFFSIWPNTPEVRKLFSLIQESSVISDHEISLADGSGEVKTFSVTARLLFDSIGNPTKIVGIMRDITRRKQIEDELRKSREHLEDSVMERTAQLIMVNESLNREITERRQVDEKLRESEKKYRQLFDNIQDIFFRTDKEGNITMLSPSIEKILHYKPEEVIGENLISICGLSEEDVEALVTEIEEFGQAKNVEAKIISKEGSARWLQANISHFTDENSQILGIEGIARDITERKQIEEKLIIKNRELSDFAYRVSHDLKSPVNIIRGYITAIRENPHLFGKLYDKIDKQAEHLLKFIDNLLNLSRAGRVIDRMAFINFSLLLKQIFAFMDNSGINVRLDIQHPLHQIYGDRKSLEQVFGNLIQNSIKYRDQEKQAVTINVRTALEKDTLVIVYKDNGSGIEEKNFENVFKAGFSLSKNGGTGFGLAIAGKIIEAHGGTIEVKSEGINKGAEFTIKLPYPIGKEEIPEAEHPVMKISIPDKVDSKAPSLSI